MKFRFHRGTLAESMETVVEIKNFHELQKLLYKTFPECDGQAITLNHACYDDRINWDTYYVCLDGKCIGMSDGALKTYEEEFDEAFDQEIANWLFGGKEIKEETEIKTRKWSL